MGRRVESPSSINTYKQCARKYYYQYVTGLPLKPNVYFARGHVAHKVLEKLFSFNPKSKDELYETALRLLKKYWDEEIENNFGFNESQKELVRKMLLHAKEHNLRAAKRARASFVIYGYMLGQKRGWSETRLPDGQVPRLRSE